MLTLSRNVDECKPLRGGSNVRQAEREEGSAVADRAAVRDTAAAAAARGVPAGVARAAAAGRGLHLSTTSQLNLSRL